MQKDFTVRKSNKKILAFLLIFIFIGLLISNSSSFADKAMRKMISERFSEQRDMCLVIKSLIQGGENIKEIIRTSIEMGYNACFVIRCAIEGGGTLEPVLTGAIEAGETPDVISRCAIDAGKNPSEIARILEQSPATISALPEGDRGGGIIEEPEEPVISPSSP